MIQQQKDFGEKRKRLWTKKKLECTKTTTTLKWREDSTRIWRWLFLYCFFFALQLICKKNHTCDDGWWLSSSIYNTIFILIIYFLWEKKRKIKKIKIIITKKSPVFYRESERTEYKKKERCVCWTLNDELPCEKRFVTGKKCFFFREGLQEKYEKKPQRFIENSCSSPGRQIK